MVGITVAGRTLLRPLYKRVAGAAPGGRESRGAGAAGLASGQLSRLAVWPRRAEPAGCGRLASHLPALLLPVPCPLQRPTTQRCSTRSRCSWCWAPRSSRSWRGCRSRSAPSSRACCWRRPSTTCRRGLGAGGGLGSGCAWLRAATAATSLAAAHLVPSLHRRLVLSSHTGGVGHRALQGPAHGPLLHDGCGRGLGPLGGCCAWLQVSLGGCSAQLPTAVAR